VVNHHTLIHFNEPKAQPSEPEHPATSTPSKTKNVNAVASYVLSKTVTQTPKFCSRSARVRVYSPYRRFITVRALLDQGSVSTFITESLAQRLRFIRINRSVCISEMQSVMHHTVQITITPSYRDRPAYSTTALILRSLTKYLPGRVNTIYN